MKKNGILVCILALVAVAAIIFGVVANNGKTDLQKKVDELTASVTELTKAADTAKADAEAAVAAAKEEAAAANETAIAEAVAAANAELEAVKADAAAAAEAAAKELEDAKAAAAEAAAAAAKELEDAKAAAAEAAAAAAKELEDAKTAAAAELEAVKAEAAAAAAKLETIKAVAEPEPAKTEEAPKAEEAAKGVMTHADYVAAALETEVTVETYVQAKQGWWDDKATVYTQAEDGAYFLYNMPISEEDYAKLVPGTKIRVTGYKSEWSGEIEITDATFEILEADPFIATPADVTDLLGKDELVDHQNELVTVKGVTVAAYDETGAAFAYKDPVGKTDDLYFKVTKDDQTFEFCVEFYLCGQDTDVYKAVEALNVGDVIDLEGFLYWYNGANLQATALTVAK